MALIKKIRKKIATAMQRKKRQDVPDMPTDPKELARAMFWENDHKRFEQEQQKESR